MTFIVTGKLLIPLKRKNTIRSSVSFLHLMQLHSEWVQRFNRWDRENEEAKIDETPVKSNVVGRRGRGRIPFVVVANKIDLLEKSDLMLSSVPPKRRSVMGFGEGKYYKGKDLVYEFAVENASSSKESECPMSDDSSRRPTNNRLTYSLKETSWSNDRIYLRALQLTEDQLPANRLLILLWCQRNDIPHFEASALDGRGVEEAMKHLIMVGIEELQLREEEERLNAMRREREVDYLHDDYSKSRASTHNVEGTNPMTPDNTVELNASEEGMTEIYNHAQDTSATNDNEIHAIRGPPPVNGVATVDPSQYYFLYQPRQDESLDLFARYSGKKRNVSSCFCKCC